MPLLKSSFIPWRFAAVAAAALLGAALASTPALAAERGDGGSAASSLSFKVAFADSDRRDRRGDRRHHRGDRHGDRHRSRDRRGDRHRDHDRKADHRRHDRRAHHRRHDRRADRHHRRHDRRAHHRHDRRYAYGGRSHRRHHYAGRRYRHGHGPGHGHGHGYFCLDHGIFHYYSGYDPYGFSVTAYYRGSSYRGGGDCYPVEKHGYYHGRRALIGGLMCTDAYGYAYIRPGSRYVIRYY